MPDQNAAELAEDARVTAPLPADPSAAEDARSTLPLAQAEGDTVPLAQPPLPQRIGRFEVRGWLGSGAFGDVYRAYDSQLDREVALKVAKPGTLDTPERMARFLREAKAAANLRHPNIVPLYETGHDGDRQFIVSAFIPGRTLEAVIQEANEKGEPLPLAVAAAMARKLADALAYAHSQGVVHRDVKPANVLVGAAGEPHLLDFGLAARAEAGDERLTRDGQGMGTPAYMAPEQADGEGIAASDQYSLGCALYELVTGRTPFAGGPAQQMFLHRTEPVPTVRKVRADVPRDLDTVVAKCLEKESGRRYGSCGEVAEDLRRFAAGEPVTARRIGPLERTTRWARRNPAVAVSVLAAVLAMTVGTGISLWQAGEARWQAELARTQKKAADDSADDAKREAKRANDNKQLADVKTADAVGEAKRANDEAKESRRRLDLSKLRESQSAWEKNQVGLARDLLADVAPENRCVVWRLLRQRFEGSQLTLYGHAGWVDGAVFTPDGTEVVTAGSGEIVTWDARTGERRRGLSLPAGAGRTVCLSPDGVTVGTTAGKTVRLWDRRTGAKVGELSGHPGPVNGLAFSPDGKRLLVAVAKSAKPGGVWVWDVGERKVLKEVPEADGVYSVAASPDGRWAASASKAGLRVWDAATGEAAITIPDATAARGVCFSPDGTRLLAVTGAAGVTGSVAARVWDVRTARKLLELGGPTHFLQQATFSPDGARVATAGGKSAQVWDATTGRLLLDLKGHSGTVSCVAFSPDCRRLVTGSSDCTARVWDVRTLATVELKSFAGGTPPVAVSPDGRRVAGVGDKGGVWVADARTGQTLHRFDLGDSSRVVVWLAFSGDGRRLAVAVGDEVQVWGADTGRRVFRKSVPGNGVFQVCFFPDGRKLACAAQDQTVRLLDAESGEAVFELGGHGDKVAGVSVSPDGKRVASTAGDGVWVWDARSGERLLDLRGHTEFVTGVCFSPDGTTLATSSADGSGKVWDAKTGRPLAEWFGDGVGAFRVAYAADGRVVTCGMNTRVWDATTGQLLLELPGEAAGFAADGSCAATCSSVDAAVRVWDARPLPSPLELRGHSGLLAGLRVSPDGGQLVVGGIGVARVWDTRTGRLLHQLIGHHGGGVECISYSADGGRLGTASWGKPPRVWHAHSGELAFSLEGHTGQVTGLSFSTDGSAIATGGTDGTARVWDGKDGRLRLTITEPTGSVHRVAFTADGKRLAGATSTGVRVWDTATGGAVGEYKGVTAVAEQVAFSADGTRVIAHYPRLPSVVWDAKTGVRVDELVAPLPPANVSPDGEYQFAVCVDRVIRVPTHTSPAERRRRADLSLPGPDWHMRRQTELAAEKNEYGVAVHRAAEARARGVVAFGVNDFDKAWAHFIRAALSHPVPKAIEIPSAKKSPDSP